MPRAALLSISARATETTTPVSLWNAARISTAQSVGDLSLVSMVSAGSTPLGALP